jgi:hypothetical protein
MNPNRIPITNFHVTRILADKEAGEYAEFPSFALGRTRSCSRECAPVIGNGLAMNAGATTRIKGFSDNHRQMDEVEATASLRDP